MAKKAEIRAPRLVTAALRRSDHAGRLITSANSRLAPRSQGARRPGGPLRQRRFREKQKTLRNARPAALVTFTAEGCNARTWEPRRPCRRGWAVSRALLNPRAADHLAKLCGMFGSDFDGEVLTAARMANEHVRRLGLSWGDVIGVDVDWRVMARACRDRPLHFSDKERKFVVAMARWRGTPSDKQLEWLSAFYERIRREEAA